MLDGVEMAETAETASRWCQDGVEMVSDGAQMVSGGVEMVSDGVQMVSDGVRWCAAGVQMVSVPVSIKTVNWDPSTSIVNVEGTGGSR